MHPVNSTQLFVELISMETHSVLNRDMLAKLVRHSLLTSTTWNNNKLRALNVRTMISGSMNLMHTGFTTLTMMPWSSPLKLRITMFIVY